MDSSLSEHDLRSAIGTLQEIAEATHSGEDFAKHGIELLPQLVASDLTTLSVCDLNSGHRSVLCNPAVAMGRREIEVFDRYFYDHPLVRAHGRNRSAVTTRVSDIDSDEKFQASPLFNDYYRPIDLHHVMAVPLHVDDHFLVGIVLNRRRRGFSDRDRDVLELIRPHLANLYRLGVAIDCAGPAPAHFDKATQFAAANLTAREREVLDWLAAGKTNRDIAAILGAKPRTVEKHLEHIYVKLGVETRTAAVMRTRDLPASRWPVPLPDQRFSAQCDIRGTHVANGGNTMIMRISNSEHAMNGSAAL